MRGVGGGLTSKLIKNSAMQIVLAKLIKGVDGQPSGFFKSVKKCLLACWKILKKIVISGSKCF